jgi:hypothetical protein
LPAGPRSIAGLTVYTIGEAVADQEGSGGRQRSRA